MLSFAEQQRIAYHLGFPVGTFPPGLTQVSAMIIEPMTSTARTLIGELDKIETETRKLRKSFQVSSLSGIAMNAKAVDDMERQYEAEARKLAELLGVPVNESSSRFGGIGVSVVRRSLT